MTKFQHVAAAHRARAAVASFIAPGSHTAAALSARARVASFIAQLA